MLEFHTPPEYQGQFAAISFAGGRDGIYMREVMPCGTTSYHCCAWDDFQGEFQPWNEAPEVPDHAWRRLSRQPEE